MPRYHVEVSYGLYEPGDQQLTSKQVMTVDAENELDLCNQLGERIDETSPRNLHFRTSEERAAFEKMLRGEGAADYMALLTPPGE